MLHYYNIAIYQNDKTAILQYHFIAIPQNYNILNVTKSNVTK